MKLEDIPEINPQEVPKRLIHLTNLPRYSIAKILDRAEIITSEPGFVSRGLYYVLGKETSKGVLYVK